MPLVACMFVGLSVYLHSNLKSYASFLMKFPPNVNDGSRNRRVDFGGYHDHLDFKIFANNLWHRPSCCKLGNKCLMWLFYFS